MVWLGLGTKTTHTLGIIRVRVSYASTVMPLGLGLGLVRLHKVKTNQLDIWPQVGLEPQSPGCKFLLFTTTVDWPLKILY